MPSEYTTETCQALLREVVRNIRVVCELGEGVLVDRKTIKRHDDCTLTFDVCNVTPVPGRDVPFDDCGMFENNLALIVGQLTKFNCDAQEHMCHLQVLRRSETVMKFHQYDVNELMRVCRRTPTSEYVPHLVSMVKCTRLVAAGGHKD